MRFLSAFLASFTLATTAHAHSGDGSASGIAHDMLHALGGPDHLIALISVGLLFLAIALAPLAGRLLARSLAAARTFLARR